MGKTPFSRTGRQACSWCPHSQGGTWGTRAGPRPPFALSRAARRAPVHRPPTQRHWPRPDLADLLVPAARPLPPGQARPLPSHLWPVQRPLPDPGASRLPLRALTAPAKGGQGEEDQGVRAPHGGQDHPAPQLLLRQERWSWEGKRTGGARDPRSPAEPGGQRLWLHPLGGRGGEGAGPCGSLRTDWGLPALLERRLQDSACVLRPAGETEADACTEALHSQGSGWAPGRRSPDFACGLNAGLRRSLGNDLESGSLGFAERGAARIGGG